MSVIGPVKTDEAHKLLNAAFQEAVQSSLPHNYLRQTGLIDRIRDLPRKIRCHIIGIGKGAAAMAVALEKDWPRTDAPAGVVVTRDGYSQHSNAISMLHAGHPLPDTRSGMAADYVLAYLADLNEDDFVVALISGGGSALLSKPVRGLSVEDLRNLTHGLMGKGVPINDLNIVRKHLTSTLGGKLARAAYPARIDAVILSDVAGDDASTIASGPFHPDSSTLADARKIIEQAQISTGSGLIEALVCPDNETPPSDDPIFNNVRTTIIPADCWMNPVVKMLEDAGFAVDIIDPLANDDARHLARRHAAHALSYRGSLQPVAILSGGEATVELRGDGAGGPNAEYALQLAVELNGVDGIWAIACDTDGTDGPTDAAGAIIAPTTLQRGNAVGLCAEQALSRSDSGTYFSKLGDAVLTGPTLTNVNDMRLILILPDSVSLDSALA